MASAVIEIDGDEVHEGNEGGQGAVIEIDGDEVHDGNEGGQGGQGDETLRPPQLDVVIVDSESDTESHEVQVLSKRMRRRRSWVAGYQLGVSPKEYRRLKRMHAPRLLFFLMHALMLCHSSIPRIGWLRWRRTNRNNGTSTKRQIKKTHPETRPA
mgnify:CR=1 FL=1